MVRFPPCFGRILVATVAVVVCCAAFAAQADVLVIYDGSESDAYAPNAASVAAGVNATSLAVANFSSTGSSTLGNPPPSIYIGGVQPDIDTTTLYAAFTLTATSGLLNIDSISFDYSYSNDQTAGTFGLRSSVTGYDFADQITSVSTPASGYTPTAFVSSGDLALGGSSFSGLSTITFRIYMGDTSSVNRTFRIDNVQVNGSVVPEPASLALIGMGLLCIRRRKSRLA